MKFTKQLVLTSLPLLLVAEAQDNTRARINRLSHEASQISTMTPRNRVGAELAPATPKLNSHRVYLTADALLIRLFEDARAFTHQIPKTPSSLGQDLNDTDSNFDWKWGFKTGLGYYAPHDSWQTGLELSYFQTQTSDFVTAPQNFFQSRNNFLNQAGTLNLGGYFTSSNQSPANQYIANPQSAKQLWKVSFYNLEWRLGKDFFVSKYLSLLPEIGVKSSWFYQQRKTIFTLDGGSYQGFAPGTTTPTLLNASLEGIDKHKDNFWGIGPKADLLAKFWLGKNFCFIGKIDAALLYAQNRISYDIQTFPRRSISTAQYVYATDNQKKYQISPYFGFDIGASYNTNFKRDAYNFEVALSWGQQYYNKACRMLYIQSPTYFDVSFETIDIAFKLSF